MTETLPRMREGELEQIRKKYPERIPIVVTKSAQSDRSTPELKRHKFLVPNYFTFGELIHTVRKWLAVTPEKSIFLFIVPVDKKTEFMPSPSMLLVELHDTHRHRNGVLYVVYAAENTFGGEQDVPSIPLCPPMPPMPPMPLGN